MVIFKNIINFSDTILINKYYMLIICNMLTPLQYRDGNFELDTLDLVYLLYDKGARKKYTHTLQLPR